MRTPPLVLVALLLTSCLPGQSRRDAHVEDLDARVTALEAQNAELKSELSLLDARLAQVEARGTTPSSASPRAPASDAPTTYCVARGSELVLVGELDLEELSRSARVVPHRGADGVQDGYRVSGVRPASFLATCGLKNGDVAHAINGVALTSIDAASAAYELVRTADSATLELVRRGKPETVTVTLPAP